MKIQLTVAPVLAGVAGVLIGVYVVSPYRAARREVVLPSLGGQPIEERSTTPAQRDSARVAENQGAPLAASGAVQEAAVGRVQDESVDRSLWSNCEPFFHEKVLGPSVEERAEDILSGMRFQARELAKLPARD